MADNAVAANRATNESWNAVDQSTKKEARELKELGDMQFRLDKILAQLKGHLEVMAQKRSSYQEATEENSASQVLYSARRAEQLVVQGNGLTVVSGRMESAWATIHQNEAAKATTEAAKVEPAATNTGGKWQPLPAVVVATTTAELPAASPGGFSDSGGAMDKVNYDDEGGNNADEDAELSDAETEAGVEITSLEEWKQHVAQWVFQSQPGDTPQESVIKYFNVWGDDETNKTLTQKITEIRDRSLSERMADISDSQAILDMEATGDTQAGYAMRIQRGLYSRAKFNELLTALRSEIDKAVLDLQAKRAEDIESGKVKESAKCKATKGKSDKSLNRVTKAAFEKKKADKRTTTGTRVAGQSATAALAEAEARS